MTSQIWRGWTTLANTGMVSVLFSALGGVTVAGGWLLARNSISLGRGLGAVIVGVRVVLRLVTRGRRGAPQGIAFASHPTQP